MPNVAYVIACDGPGCGRVFTVDGKTGLMERSSAVLHSAMASILAVEGWQRVGRSVLCPDCDPDAVRDRWDQMERAMTHTPLFDPPPVPQPADCLCPHITPGVRPHPHQCPHPSGVDYAQAFERDHRTALEQAPPPGTPAFTLARQDLVGLLADAYDEGHRAALLRGRYDILRDLLTIECGPLA